MKKLTSRMVSNNAMDTEQSSHFHLEKQKLEGVIFDLDGTLIDSATLHFRVYQKVLAKFGKYFTREQYQQAYSPNWFVTYSRLGLSDDLHDSANQLWLEFASQETPRLFPGAYDLLERLFERFPLGLVTSGGRDRVLHDMEAVDIAQFFSAIITAEDVTQPKPDPEGLTMALALLKTAPERTVFVGDTFSDFLTAAAGRLQFIGIQNDMLPLPDNLPAPLVHAIAEIEALLD